MPLNRLLTLGVLAAQFLIFSIFANGFLTVGGVLNLLVQTSTYAIVSIGSALVLIVGGIDFSLGAVVALSGHAVVWLVVLGAPVWISMIAAASLGGVIGLANGFLVARLRLPPFITTLGTLMTVYGILGSAAPHVRAYPVPQSLGDLANTPVFRLRSHGAAGLTTVAFPGVSWLVIIMVVVAVLFHVMLRKTMIGRYAYLVGSNEAAARFSGIQVRRITVTAYVLAGLLAGLAGVLLASRVVGTPGAAEAYPFIGIICAMIGGASLAGGTGSVGGTVIGSFIISTLAMGLTMLNTSSPGLPLLFNGIVILVAVHLDQVRNRGWADRRSV